MVHLTLGGFVDFLNHQGNSPAKDDAALSEVATDTAAPPEIAEDAALQHPQRQPKMLQCPRGGRKGCRTSLSLSSARTPELLEPPWSVPLAQPWPSTRVPVRPGPPWSIPPAQPWPSAGDLFGRRFVGLSLQPHPGYLMEFLFGRNFSGSSLLLCPGLLPGLQNHLSLPGSTLLSLPDPF